MDRKMGSKWRPPHDKSSGDPIEGSKMMPAHLFVLSFIRIGQVILCLVLFWKAYHFQLNSSIDVFCRSNLAGNLGYAVAFPFREVAVTGISDCTKDSPITTTRIWTGFGPTVVLFTILITGTIVYAITAVCVYALRHEDYDADKKWPAIDLLVSLMLAGLWTLDCFLAYHNYPGLKETVTPDAVINRLSVCSQAGGYCNEATNQEFGESMNSFLFLGLACGLSCAVAVWFLVMETGLCPDQEDDEDLMYSDLTADGLAHLVHGTGSQKLRPDFVPFPDHMMTKGPSAPMDAGPENEVSMRERELMQAQFANYLTTWKRQQDVTGYGTVAADGDEDRFANGFTFAPIRDPSHHVATISHSELKRDAVGDRLKSKFNLFKA